MCKIVNKFLLGGDKFMSKMHITCIAYRPFTNNKDKNEKTGDSQYIYQNELDKARFQHDIAHRDYG